MKLDDETREEHEKKREGEGGREGENYLLTCIDVYSTTNKIFGEVGQSVGHHNHEYCLAILK